MNLLFRVLLVCAIALSSASAAAADDVVRGLVKAVDEAVLSSRLQARIRSTPFRTGESFRKGDTLISFDCSVELAEADAAEASQRAARAQYESTVELQQFGAGGQLDVNIAKAEMDERAALVRARRAGLRDCNLKAPWAGKVSELMVSAFETPALDSPLIKIVSPNVLELRLIVPSNWLIWLEPGYRFQFEVDETGVSYAARVSRIGAEVDAVSRTAAIIAEFEAETQKVLPGMSGTALFPQRGG